MRQVHEFDPDVDNETEDLVNAFQLGRSMVEFCERNPAGRKLVEDAQARLRDAIDKWLKESDTGSDVARQAHFEARVAVELLKTVETAVLSGRNAEQVISEHEASSDPLDGFR